MTTAQKLGLSSVALICLILIGFYLGKGDPRDQRTLPAASAVTDTAPAPRLGGEEILSDNRSALVLPSAADQPRATGLDAIVSRIKSETDPAANSGSGPSTTLASNTPAAAPTVDRVVPLTEASTTVATGSTQPNEERGTGSISPVVPPAATPASADLPITPAPTSAAPGKASTEAPSLTLGAAGATEKTPSNNPTPLASITPAKDDPKQFADLPIIDEADPALARGDAKGDGTGREAGTPVTGSNAPASKPAGSPITSERTADSATRTTDSKREGISEAGTTDNTATTAEPHAALPVAAAIPTIVPKPDANKPAVKPEVTAPKEPPKAVESASAGKPYTIKAGDSFSSIAMAVYGAEKHWIEIAEANPKVNPSKLKLGQMITLPELPTDLPKTDAKTSDAAASEAAKTANAKAADATKLPASKVADTTKANELRSPLPVKAPETKFHEVKAGENLATISRKYFNSGEHWRHIYVANREVIGSDPGRLHVGMKLKITEPVKTGN